MKIGSNNVKHRIENLLTAIILAVACLNMVGCSFHIGIDYSGKTGKSNVTESPNFRGK